MALNVLFSVLVASVEAGSLLHIMSLVLAVVRRSCSQLGSKFQISSDTSLERKSLVSVSGYLIETFFSDLALRTASNISTA